MLTAMAAPETEAMATSARARRPRRMDSPSLPTAPPPSHLQAVHASQHGVILRGQRHETFWEW